MIGKDKSDTIEIRISDHDLPPSYDLKHKGDFDIRSGNNNRHGTNGTAQNYEDFLYSIAKKKGYSSKRPRE